MKKNIVEPKPRFITDEQGNKLEVILDIATYDQLIELVEDHYLSKTAEEVLATESKEEYMDLEDFRKTLVKNFDNAHRKEVYNDLSRLTVTDVH